MPATLTPPTALSTVTESFTDGNDATLLGLVPETAALLKEIEEIEEEEEKEDDETDTSDTSHEDADETDETDTAEETEETEDPAPAAELEKLRAEVTALKSAGSAAPVVLAPTVTSPLSHLVAATELDALETQCNDSIDWVSDNPDGGEVPDDLAELLLGKAPAEPLFLDKDQTRALKKQAAGMLKTHLPARRAFIAQETAATAQVRKESPEFFDASKPESKLFEGVLQIMPALRSHPQWAAFARDWALGFSTRVAKEKAAEAKGGKGKKPAPTAVNKDGKPVPLAPGTSAGGARPSTAVADPKVAAAQKRIEAGKGTEADFTTVLSVAE